MKVKGQRFGDRERDALGKRKPLLPSDRGEARYQTALDKDRNYREMVFASIAIAAFAASGFGHSAAVVGPVRNALFCVGSVGFALRAIALRNSPYSQEGGLTKGSLGRIVVGSILGFAVFGSVLGGRQGALSLLFMATFALLVVPSTLWPKLRSLSYLAGACCLIASTTFPVGFARSYTPIETTTGVVLGIVMAAVSVITNRREPFGIEPIVVLSSMAGQSWFVLSIWAVSKSAWNPLIALAASLGLAILNSLLSSRSSFAPVVITVVFVHLSGCLASGEQLFRPVAPQVVVVILEFCLLGMASYRHAAALLAKYPLSTYRSSPQCLVPDLDHAWDHPVKIDAF